MPIQPDPHAYLRKSTTRRVVQQTRDRERARRGGDGIPDRPVGPRIVGVVGLRLARLPTTAITAGATGTITYLNAPTGTDTALNWSDSATTAASPGKKCLVGLVDGVLTILVEDC